MYVLARVHLCFVLGLPRRLLFQFIRVFPVHEQGGCSSRIPTSHCPLNLLNSTSEIQKSHKTPSFSRSLISAKAFGFPRLRALEELHTRFYDQAFYSSMQRINTHTNEFRCIRGTSAASLQPSLLFFGATMFQLFPCTLCCA